MALPPRRIGETQEQYSRRIGRNPRTIGGRRRRRLVDPIVGTPNRRKRPTVDPRRRRRASPSPKSRPTRRVLSEQEIRIRRNAALRRRKEREGRRTAEQRANLANQKKAMQALKEFRAKNPMPKQVKRRRMTIQEQGEKAIKRIPQPVGSRQKPLTPEQRKKIQQSMISNNLDLANFIRRREALKRTKKRASVEPLGRRRRPTRR